MFREMSREGQGAREFFCSSCSVTYTHITAINFFADVCVCELYGRGGVAFN